MRFSFSSRVAIFKRSCVFYSRKMRVMSSLAPTSVTVVASISKMTQYLVWVKRSLGWSFTRWLISFQLFAFSSQNPNLSRCLISFKYTLRTVSLFSWSFEWNARDTKWPHAWRKKRFFLLGLLPSFGASHRFEARACVRKKRDCSPSNFIRTLFYELLWGGFFFL